MKFISAATVFLISCLAQANDKLWSVGVTGGDGEHNDESFYGVARDFYLANQEFGIRRDRQLYLYGQEGVTCYVRQSDETRKSMKDSGDLLMKSQNCEGAAAIIGISLGSGPNIHVCNRKTSNANIVSKLEDLGGKGGDDLFGDSSRQAVERAFKKILDKNSGIQPGDHLLMNLNDHGMVIQGDSVVDLGQPDQHLSAAEMKKVISLLQEHGVTTHLNIQACFSGGFVKQLTEPSAQNPVCVTSSTRANIPASDSGPLVGDQFEATFQKNLGKFGNQLEAFACSVGSDSWNHPQSSIDDVVDQWESKEKIQPVAYLKPCEETSHLYSLKEQLNAIKKVFNNETGEELRTRLRDKFEEKFVKMLLKCERDREKNNRLAARLNQCLDTVKLDPAIRNYIHEALKTAEESSNAKDSKRVAKHLNFLKSAGTEDLQKYRNALCCLAYNFKTGANLDLCGNL